MHVCRVLVDLMGGRIAVDRMYTRGTRIVAELPLREASAEEAARLLSPVPSSEITLPPGLSWLLVDDSADVRRAHKRTLRKTGKRWVFAEAATGETALEMVASGQRFDVIVMDQFMGKAGGASADPRPQPPSSCPADHRVCCDPCRVQGRCWAARQWKRCCHSTTMNVYPS